MPKGGGDASIIYGDPKDPFYLGDDMDYLGKYLVEINGGYETVFDTFEEAAYWVQDHVDEFLS